MKQKTIYLGGPDVFLPNAIEHGKKKKELCSQYGFIGLYPFDNEVPENTINVDRFIYFANMKMMSEADIGIFNLTPFRGVSADVGTVFELGVFIGRGKPVFGYTNELKSYFERVSISAYGASLLDDFSGKFIDEDGYSIEKFNNNLDNLMIDNALQDNFVKLDRNYKIDDLDGFEECLKKAQQLVTAFY